MTRALVALIGAQWLAGCAAQLPTAGDPSGLQYGNPCANAAGGGDSAICSVGMMFNDQDLGVTVRSVSVGESRGCQEISAETDVTVDGDTTNLKITLDESTQKVTLTSSLDGSVSLEPGLHADSIWVTTYQAGMSQPISHEVTCPDLENEIAQLALRLEEPEECGAGEPNDESVSVDFRCEELDEYLAADPVHQSMFGHLAHVAVAHTLVEDIRAVAGARAGGSRAQVGGGVGLLFGSLFSFAYQEQNFNITNNFFIGYNNFPSYYSYY